MAKQLWQPADNYDADDIRSLQALALYALGADRPWPPGEEPPVPSPLDVRRALDCIVHKLSQTYENPAMAAFAAGDPNVVWFISGRASVGQAISKLLTLKAELFEGKKKDQG